MDRFDKLSFLIDPEAEYEEGTVEIQSPYTCDEDGNATVPVVIGSRFDSAKHELVISFSESVTRIDLSSIRFVTHNGQEAQVDRRDLHAAPGRPEKVPQDQAPLTRPALPVRPIVRRREGSPVAPPPLPSHSVNRVGPTLSRPPFRRS